MTNEWKPDPGEYKLSPTLPASTWLHFEILLRQQMHRICAFQSFWDSFSSAIKSSTVQSGTATCGSPKGIAALLRSLWLALAITPMSQSLFSCCTVEDSCVAARFCLASSLVCLWIFLHKKSFSKLKCLNIKKPNVQTFWTAVPHHVL